MDELIRKFHQSVEDEAWHHSRLGIYMRDHPEKMQEAIDAAAGDWDWIARALAVAGISDHTHSDPTPETARETWKRVEARRRAGMALKPKPGGR